MIVSRPMDKSDRACILVQNEKVNKILQKRMRAASDTQTQRFVHHWKYTTRCVRDSCIRKWFYLITYKISYNIKILWFYNITRLNSRKFPCITTAYAYEFLKKHSWNFCSLHSICTLISHYKLVHKFPKNIFRPPHIKNHIYEHLKKKSMYWKSITQDKVENKK